MRVRALIFGLLLLGGLLGVGAWYLLSRPRLLEVFPPPGAASIQGQTPLRLAFSQPMQPESVNSRLTTRPARSGVFTWEGNTLIFTPDQPWPSGQTVAVRLAAGSRTDGAISLHLQEETSWEFSVRRPRLAYLWPAQGLANLFTLDPVTTEASQLTDSRFGILDFSLAAGGESIYLSEGNTSGGSDLLRMRWDQSAGAWDRAEVLLACPQAFCRSPRPSPDQVFLAYERNPLPGAAQSLFPQVYLLELQVPGQSPTTAPAPRPAGDPGHITRLPFWSSKGILSFYDVQSKAYIFLDPRSEEITAIPNDTGETGVWSPDGNLFIAPEILFPASDSGGGASEGSASEGSASEGGAEDLPASHLFAFNLSSRKTIDLSHAPTLEDVSPAFAPDGQLLAFARKYLDPARWTPGRQIWLMRLDGSQARPLTHDPYTSHSSFAWSPDSTLLAYQRFNQEAPTEPVELWLMDADGGRATRLAIGAFAPQWIP
jgi:TolB protein